MKLTSSTKLTDKYNIDEVFGNKCNVTFIDLDSEVETEVKDEEGNVVGHEYFYDAYKGELILDMAKIEEKYDSLLAILKQKEYDKLAQEIRTKRNQLLNESDKYMALDRLSLDTSSAIKFLASLKNIFNNNYAKYRQELRDITKQQGFPYNVTFPEEPKGE